MTIDQKLKAIRDLIQVDAGGRGLARDPLENLLTACPDDFAAACRSIAGHNSPMLGVVTGFHIPTAEPPALETDGPLGALFLARALTPLGIPVMTAIDPHGVAAMNAGYRAAGLPPAVLTLPDSDDPDLYAGYFDFFLDLTLPTHLIALERVGPSLVDGRCYTMSGRDVTDQMRPAYLLFEKHLSDAWQWGEDRIPSIGIGDGGNEIGMGKIAHETICRNIPRGDLIHCRVATDQLIVSGVSNWGAYALAVGVALLRGHELPAELFDVERERELLRVMVEAGPLVDGVTGRPSVTVDGLPFDEYAKVLPALQAIAQGQ